MLEFFPWHAADHAGKDAICRVRIDGEARIAVADIGSSFPYGVPAIERSCQYSNAEALDLDLAVSKEMYGIDEALHVVIPCA